MQGLGMRKVKSWVLSAKFWGIALECLVTWLLLEWHAGWSMEGEGLLLGCTADPPAQKMELEQPALPPQQGGNLLSASTYDFHSGQLHIFGMESAKGDHFSSSSIFRFPLTWRIASTRFRDII